MKWMLRALLLGVSPTVSMGAQAAELRDYCPDRPGIGTPACTIDKGHVSVEIGLADWTRDRSADERDSQWLFGDTLFRFGLGDSTELQLEWNGYGRDDDLDRTTGIRAVTHRAGDITIAMRQNLHDPDGSGFALAVQPFVSLPVGRAPIGAGDWGAGLIVPASYELDDTLSVELVPEIDAATDADGNGRHLSYGAVAGLAAKLSRALTATAEVQGVRDDDPDGHATQALAGLSLGWQPRPDLQFDIGSNAGLNHASADIEVYVGVSRRF